MVRIALTILMVVLFQYISIANLSLLDQANNALSKKEFQLALNSYSEIEKNGLGGTGVYQNMALAAAGLQQDALAILYLEKALKYAPNDRLIQENLSAIVKRNSQLDNNLQFNGLNKFLHKAVGFLSISAWTILSLISFLAIGAIFVRFYPKIAANKMLKISVVSLALFFAISSIGAYVRHQNIFHSSGIIITKENTVLRLGPDAESPEVSALPPGSKVTMRDHLAGWWLVETAYGDQGWVPTLSGQRI